MLSSAVLCKRSVFALALLVCCACQSAEHPRGVFHSIRDGLNNSRTCFEDGYGRVAFLGGSITHNPGWRDQVCRWLKRRFPSTEFDFVNAGIPSMGSTPGAFRLDRDVLSGGTVHLLFVEAAVNDHANGRSAIEQLRGMEGIVRHVRSRCPLADIVMLHFAMPAHVASYRAGRRPAVIASHERVADHYGVASLDLAHEVTARIDAGEFNWERDFVDLHPSPFGQRLYAQSIVRLLGAAWAKPLPPAAGRLWSLPDPLDGGCYSRGRLVDPERADAVSGFTLERAWRPRDGKPTRRGFVDVPMLVAEKPGASLSLSFEGTAVGVFVVAGPDAGIIEFRIDGGSWRRVDLFTRWSASLHLPWVHVLVTDLERSRHRLELRIGAEQNPRSSGHAVRIAHFVVN